MIYLHVESHVQRGMHAVSGLFVCFVAVGVRARRKGNTAKVFCQVFDFMAGLHFFPPLRDTIVPIKKLAYGLETL